MKYNQIDNTLFIKNRKNFAAQMKPKSLAVFNSNDIYPVVQIVRCLLSNIAIFFI